MMGRFGLGMRWYHWMLVVVITISGQAQNSSQPSPGTTIGLLIASLIAVKILVSLWRAVGEFRRGIYGETDTERGSHRPEKS